MNIQLVVADWCPQCPQARKTWSELCREFGFSHEEVEINSEKGHELAARFGIKGVPTVVINGTVYAPSDAAGARDFLAQMGRGAGGSRGR